MSASHPSPDPAPDTAVEFAVEKLHLRKLLVPTDFSKQSHKAMHYAIELAKQFGSTIVLLHVVEPVYTYPVDGVMHFPGDLQDPGLGRRPAAEKALEQLAAETTARNPGVALRAAIQVGRAYDVITRIAREEQADLIVVSTHGYTGINRLFLGSTAERVVRHAPCPVLVVREHEHDFA